MIFILMISVIFFVMCDLWAGLRKSRSRGEKSASYGFRKTIEKTSKYYNYMFILLGIDFIQMSLLSTLNRENDHNFWIIPILTAAGAFFIGFIEVKSVFENESEKEQQRMKDAAYSAKQIIDYINEKELSDKKDRMKKGRKRKEEEEL